MLKNCSMIAIVAIASCACTRVALADHTTPQDAAAMVKNSQHSLSESIATAERHSGGKAVRAECCLRKDTPHAGATPGNDNDTVCKVTLVVGDNKLVEVCVCKNTNKVLGQRDIDRMERHDYQKDGARVDANRDGMDRDRVNRDGNELFIFARSWQKASDLTGKKVTNSANEDLGKIEDIVVDGNSGRILYGVLSFGGFLGMGDKLFAIPWRSMPLAIDGKTLVLNVDKDRLKKASGFDKSHWPNFADEQFATTTFQYYNERPYWQAGQVGVQSGVQPVSDDERRTRTYYRSRWNQRATAWQKASDLMGKDCRNHKNEDLGKISDLAIDHEQGRILYGILKYRGKLFAIPYPALTLANEYKHYVLNIEQSELKDADGFNDDTWPNLTDPRWATDTYTRYRVEPYWQ